MGINGGITIEGLLITRDHAEDQRQMLCSPAKSLKGKSHRDERGRSQWAPLAESRLPGPEGIPGTVVLVSSCAIFRPRNQDDVERIHGGATDRNSKQHNIRLQEIIVNGSAH